MTDSSLPRLDTLDIDTVVHRMQQHPGDIVFEQRVSIPEADVLCCRYKGERFNVKFDSATGCLSIASESCLAKTSKTSSDGS